jgi:hypothetical protein
MNRFDLEFWNGSLKTAILIDSEIKKLLEISNESEKDGIKIALKRIEEIKNDIEGLNGNSVKKALKNYIEIS